MRLDEILERVADTADFAGIDVRDPNVPGLFGNRPLHVVSCWGDCEAILALVAAGARIDEQGEHGFTPLMEAVAQGHRSAAALLIELGARPIRNDDGQSPSEYASIGDAPDLAGYLAERGY
jgi:uncharacterized protein